VLVCVISLVILFFSAKVVELLTGKNPKLDQIKTPNSTCTQEPETKKSHENQPKKFAK
jgi:hypothetical protein